MQLLECLNHSHPMQWSKQQQQQSTCHAASFSLKWNSAGDAGNPASWVDIHGRQKKGRVGRLHERTGGLFPAYLGSHKHQADKEKWFAAATAFLFPISSSRSTARRRRLPPLWSLSNLLPASQKRFRVPSQVVGWRGRQTGWGEVHLSAAPLRVPLHT